MILALDVGNSNIYGGVFAEEQIKLRFRTATKHGSSSDELGLFLKSVLRENEIDPAAITRIAFCSVVPDLDFSLRHCCRKYFDLNPFVVQAGVKTGLKIKYRNPLEVGADRIVNAIGATHLHPKKNLIIIDFGTATTFDVVTKEKEYLGGLIVPGMRISMEALESRTAKLPSVEIIAPGSVVGRSTVESIQSGLYYGHLAMIEEISRRVKAEAFGGERALIVGTGGFASMFEKEKVFDDLVPDLILQGLLIALQLNS